MATPKIRLKGFEGEWKTKKIGDISSFSKGRGYSKSDLRSQGHPIILYGRLYTNYSFSIESVDTFAELKENSLLSTGSEVVIPASGETAEDISIASAIKQKNIILGGDLNILTFDKEFDTTFMAMSISGSGTHTELSRYAQGKSVVHLRNSDISKADISFPNISEQQQIASYFTSLDSLIQSTTKKIDTLKQTKQACLQSMFPQEGETYPRVRFKGFEGEWKRVKIHDLYRRSIIKNDLTYGTDKIISVANMYYIKSDKQINEDYLKSYNVMRLGDIAFEGNKSKHFAHGRFVENVIGDGIVSHVFVVLRPISNKYDLNFWKYYINNEEIMGDILIRSTKSSTMMTDLVVDDFLQESLLVPPYEEQVKIGKYLNEIDQQISLQTQKLEKLKQIKAACLDKMFV